MKFIARFWKKLLYFLITGSTSIFIAACYGVPVGFANLGTWTIKARNQDNQPIQGLDVTTLQFTSGSAIPDTLDMQQTDSSGSCTTMLTTYDRNSAQRYGAYIKDPDGVDNGGAFSDTLIMWDGSQGTIVFMRNQQ